MKKELLAATILSAMVLGTPAFAAVNAAVDADANASSKSESSYKSEDNGGFEAKESMEHTDSVGTTTERDSKEKVNVDSKGNKKSTVTIKSTVDPKGLFNKNTTEIENKAVEKDGKTEYSHKKSINGHVQEENEEKNQ